MMNVDEKNNEPEDIFGNELFYEHECTYRRHVEHDGVSARFERRITSDD